MLRVMTYNILEGGRDRQLGERTETVLSVIRDAAPDVVGLIEANGFEDEKRRRVFEEATRMKAYHALADTGFHVAFLVRQGLEVLWASPEPDHFFHAALGLALALPGRSGGGALTTDSAGRITLLAAHLDPFTPEDRLAEARVLARFGNPRKNVLLMGDFNALPPGDPVDPSIYELPPRVLSRHIAVPASGPIPAGQSIQIDTRAHELLQWSGFQDLYRKLNPRKPGWTLLTTRFAAELRSRMRLDFMYATEALASRAVRCEVIENDFTRRASDHYPIVAEFDL